MLVAEQNSSLMKLYIPINTKIIYHFGLYTYTKIKSSGTANSPKFPQADLYMHNKVISLLPMFI